MNKKTFLIAFAASFALALLGGGLYRQSAAADISNAAAAASPLLVSPASATEIFRGDISKRQVIFTFDAGGSTESADRVLETLAKHQVRGTFFVTGEMVESHPDLVARVKAGGHEIFNHTYDHPNLTMVSDEGIAEELNKMKKSLESVVGTSSMPYFRAPYGERDVRVREVAARAGYQSVYWTVDALDWAVGRGETASRVRERILSSLAPGNIYLMHVGDGITGEILDEVFTSIESRGYAIVSLTQGL
ncbi:MAG: polysaccharide deacetylase family protein [Candidatus Paceibacterota bacterium]|jgi:peptidoglycan-N-acetylmuramic acid deacetylase